LTLGDEGGRAFDRFDLGDLGLLGKDSDLDFDTAVALAARALRTPIAAFSVLDFEAGVSRLRAHVGTRHPVTEREDIPIEASLNITVMSPTDVIAISDTSRDPVAREHPFIRAQGIQSVLAAPVMCPAGLVTALIGVHDRVPRIWTPEEKQAILGFAHLCTELILLRAALRTLGILSRAERGVA
jgi:GAF domain-containing protein